ncbi:helix-turn-helix domain-containing protein [Minwuia thermotolerans]|uniref:Uncharacterized protein n=1 Tax=Minwuia thermotolerans TaxID=2056226 RepID=A0A2M9G2K7_9PROT|nr:helix-turn-helix transcriptional regulator [Minwuia thermotolerans]PJK29930.1 hypothetical protein CVT23_09175 [Minwuia thermotolerans]
MRLDDWLAARGQGKADFASAAGLSAPTLSRVLVGRSLTRTNVDAVFRATGGEVTPNDLFGLGPDQAEAAGEGAQAPPFLSEFRPSRPGFDGASAVTEAAVRLAHRAMTGGVDLENATGVLVHAVRVPAPGADGNAKAAPGFAASNPILPRPATPAEAMR